jgi:hypothetical protein
MTRSEAGLTTAVVSRLPGFSVDVAADSEPGGDPVKVSKCRLRLASMARVARRAERWASSRVTSVGTWPSGPAGDLSGRRAPWPETRRMRPWLSTRTLSHSTCPLRQSQSLLWAPAPAPCNDPPARWRARQRPPRRHRSALLSYGSSVVFAR